MKIKKIKVRLSNQQLLNSPRLSKLKGGGLDNEPFIW